MKIASTTRIDTCTRLQESLYMLSSLGYGAWLQRPMLQTLNNARQRLWPKGIRYSPQSTLPLFI